MRQPNKNSRYRLSDGEARKLGLTPNKSQRYRLSPKQVKLLFDMDQQPIKRLFFDFETSPNFGYFWGLYDQRLTYEHIVEPMKIICVSWKWEHEDKVHNLSWKNKCDKKLLEKFIKIANKADELIAHNGDRYDIKICRTRAIYHRLPMFPKYRTLDTLKKSRGAFKFPSNRLNDIGHYLGIGEKYKHEGFSMWRKCMEGDDKALKEMLKYCDIDVILLEDIYHAVQPYITNNCHVGVLNGGHKFSCPNCGSENTNNIKRSTTAKGTVKRLMECQSCEYVYEISNADFRRFLEHN